ncbi:MULTISPECIES: substrate-binding domain-containing protein [Sinorhizobium]|uniref:substrate-binding domain-containing protein n=1 Tax=Sinorhizobium TaxID=28105 RepID=UPI0024B26D63|nr:substrate-binding domain-containing protein [Sinorhizobium terangae]WFU51929.1 substrate-binding domain-containing protein [Sinorhizobium terangae]
MVTGISKSKLSFARIACAVVVGSLFASHSSLAEEPDRLAGIVEPVVATKPLKLGVTLVHLNDDFWKGIAYGIADEAKRNNVTVAQISIAGAYGNVTQQFSQIETLQSLGVDYVVLGAAAYKGYDPQLKRLKDAGIGVIAAGIPVDSKNVDFGVTQDDEAIGLGLAKEICAAAGPDKAGAIALPGPAGAEWARLRLDGFEQGLKACPNVALVKGAVTGGLELEQGLTQVSDMLQKNPDTKFIFTPVIPLGLGAAQAARQSGIQAQVVSATIVREALPLIKNDRLLALTSEPGILMGRLIVQFAIRDHEKLSKGDEFKTQGMAYPTIFTNNAVITKKNVDSYGYDVYDLPPKDWSLNIKQ